MNKKIVGMGMIYVGALMTGFGLGGLYTIHHIKKHENFYEHAYWDLIKNIYTILDENGVDLKDLDPEILSVLRAHGIIE